jgi:hypothetical protein
VNAFNGFYDSFESSIKREARTTASQLKFDDEKLVNQHFLTPHREKERQTSVLPPKSNLSSFSTSFDLLFFAAQKHIRFQYQLRSFVFAHSPRIIINKTENNLLKRAAMAMKYLHERLEQKPNMLEHQRQSNGLGKLFFPFRACVRGAKRGFCHTKSDRR